MVRVRYVKNETGLIVSKDIEMVDGMPVEVSFHPETLEYTIMFGEETFAAGKGLSHADIKKKVKTHLVELGIEFSPETRNRKKA